MSQTNNLQVVQQFRNAMYRVCYGNEEVLRYATQVRIGQNGKPQQVRADNSAVPPSIVLDRHQATRDLEAAAKRIQPIFAAHGMAGNLPAIKQLLRHVLNLNSLGADQTQRIVDECEDSLTALEASLEATAEYAHSASTEGQWWTGPKAITHAQAVGMLRLRDKTAKEASKIMERIRDKAGDRLRRHKNGNRYIYHADDWALAVKAIQAASPRKDDDAQGIDNYLDDPAEIELRKAQIREAKPRKA